MDKGDRHLKKKVMEARPFQPKSDWNKMQGMIAASEANTSRKAYFWWGLFIGIFSILLVGAIWGMVGLEESNTPRTGQLEEVSVLSPKGRASNSLERPAPEQSPLDPRSAPFLPTDKEGGSQTVKAVPPTTSTFVYSPENNFLGRYSIGTSAKEPSELPADSVLSSSAQSQEIPDKNLLLAERSRYSAIASLDLLAQPPGLDLGGDVKPLSGTASLTSLQGTPIFPSSRPWRFGVHLYSLVQPISMDAHLSIGSHPLGYGWHPGLALSLRKELTPEYSLGLTLGSDDIFYFSGSNLDELSNFNNPPGGRGRATLILGKNYAMEVSGRWNWRREPRPRLDPYLQLGIGWTHSRTDYIEILDLDAEQLGSSEKYGRLQATQSLGPLLGNPLLINDETTPLASNQDGVRQLSENLTSSRIDNYLSMSMSLGAELHLRPRWNLDFRTTYLSRSQDGSLAWPSGVADLVSFYNFPLSNVFSAPSTVSGSYYFIQFNMGLEYKF